MAQHTGADTNSGIDIASTWGTAVALGTGDKLVAEYSPNWNSQQLTPRNHGSGRKMIETSTRANYEPIVTLTGDAGYQNNLDKIIAVFMGTSSTPSEQNASQADYLTRYTLSAGIPSKYLTYAVESSSGTVHEYPTSVVRSLTITAQPNSYLQWSAELMADSVVLSSTENDNSEITATTLTDDELIDCSFSDEFRVNSQGGAALDTDDGIELVSLEANYISAMSFVPEMRGAAGNSVPSLDGIRLEGTVTLTFQGKDDHTWDTYWNSSTVLKGQIEFEGTQIGTGDNKRLGLFYPGLVVEQAPQYAVTSEGINQMTVVCRMIAAASNPTGMNDTHPYFETTNGLTTSYLA